MVDYARMIEIVNGMFFSRRQGHGAVTLFLEREGVARSTGYRWVQQVAWRLEKGPEELARLSAELEELRRTLACAAENPPPAGLRDPGQELRFMAEGLVRGISTADIAFLLKLAGGRAVDPKTVERRVGSIEEAAKPVFQEWFAGVGQVAAGDEVFLPGPLLMTVEPVSLLITGLCKADGRGEEDWKPVFEVLEDLKRFVSDRGRGILAAGKAAGVASGADQWHLLHPARQWMGSLERTTYRSIGAEYEARAVWEAARKTQGEKRIRRAKKAYEKARRACKKAVEEFDRIEPLLAKVSEAFEYVTPDGLLNTLGRARERVRGALDELGTTRKGQRLVAKLSSLSDPLAFTHLEVLEQGLNGVPTEEVGVERERRLARTVSEVQAWRRHNKSSVDELAAAATSPGDWVEVEVLRVLDRAVRSSSYVECVNGRMRSVQLRRKRISEKFIYLVAVHHNMTPFGRGSVRKGHSPADLAGLPLKTKDWIELLVQKARELKQAVALTG